MAITRVFKLGNSQAVRLPKALHFDTPEVEIFKRGDEVILRKPRRSAWEALQRVRDVGAVVLERAPQRKLRDLDLKVGPHRHG